jgi:hypothetical protein
MQQHYIALHHHNKIHYNNITLQSCNNTLYNSTKLQHYISITLHYTIATTLHYAIATIFITPTLHSRIATHITTLNYIITSVLHYHNSITLHYIIATALNYITPLQHRYITLHHHNSITLHYTTATIFITTTLHYTITTNIRKTKQMKMRNKTMNGNTTRDMRYEPLRLTIMISCFQFLNSIVSEVDYEDRTRE